MSEDLALAASRRAHLSGRRGWSSPADAPRLLDMNVPSPIVALEDRKERNREAHRARKVRWNRGPHHRPLAVVARQGREQRHVAVTRKCLKDLVRKESNLQPTD